jgi:hypothetical protein
VLVDIAAASQEDSKEQNHHKYSTKDRRIMLLISREISLAGKRAFWWFWVV